MVKHWYRLFLALMIAVCTHTVSADEYLTPNTSNLANTFITVDLSTTPSDDFNAPTDDSGSILNDYMGPLFLSSSRRVISDSWDADQKAAPDYHLLIAFLAPPLLALATRSTSLIPPQRHWTSRTQSAPSRVAGWKEANTLYAHRQPHSN
ncbi:hypothetical protein L1D34_12105 [Vibrio mediterranei]|uniref:hypothetical protein n=1 Tax=Vibrio mediterranei TaxID=689 RepID=UPI001EFCBC44|nr:hypothetical protein [Vibrio mediterranei]MCG9625584.1 hypothetical protein [Vibrio mediterranei]